MEELFTGFFSKEPKTCQKGQNGIVQFRHVHNKKTTSHMVGDVSNSISASSLSHIQHSIVISILSSSAALEFTFVRVKKGQAYNTRFNIFFWKLSHFSGTFGCFKKRLGLIYHFENIVGQGLI